MGDALIHAANQATHDNIVRQVLRKLSDAGLTFNETCEFSKDAIKFLGHIIDGNGIRPDPETIAAISNYPPPTSLTKLRRFLGMTGQLGKVHAKSGADQRTTPSAPEEIPVTDLRQGTGSGLLKDQRSTSHVLAHYSP